MFHQPIHTTAPAQKKTLEALIPILSAEQLLEEPKRHVLIQSMRTLSEFEPASFEHLCQRLLHNLCNLCQRLPESTVYFSQLGGFLDHRLQRTEAAIALFRQYLITNSNESLSVQQKQWWYALFSASLLRGIGQLCLNYQVERYSNKGEWIKIWEPLLEPIGNLNHVYGFEFKTHQDLAFRHRLTLLLAQQLLPEAGFEWLVSNQDVLATWLALLQEDAPAAGALSAILDRADSIVIQHELNHLPIQILIPRAGERRVRISTFVDNTPAETGVDKERMAAIEFIRWLSNAIEHGRFILNRAPILSVPGGLLICIEAFQLFVREHVSYKNWQAVQRSLLSLPLQARDAAQAALMQHEQHEGLFVPGSILLPETLNHVEKNTNITQSTTATAWALSEFATRLSPQGTWLKHVQNTPEAFIQPKAP